jgi:hypothetical protein
MRIDIIRRSATVAICSGVLTGFLFAAGCSDRPASGNKLDDPELKANMQPMWDQFKAKTQDMKDKMKRGSSKRPGRP